MKGFSVGKIIFLVFGSVVTVIVGLAIVSRIPGLWAKVVQPR